MNICVFGDSITWGVSDSVGGGWVNSLRNSFEQKGGDVVVYNLGVVGDTTTDLLNHLEVEALVRKPEIVILAIGINDAQFIYSANGNRTSDRDFKNNLQKISTIAKKFASKIIFIGLTSVDESKTDPIPWNTDKSYLNRRIKKLDKIIQAFCQKNHFEFIAVNDLLEKEDLADGLHPNTNGHSKLLRKITPIIESFLAN